MCRIRCRGGRRSGSVRGRPCRCAVSPLSGLFCRRGNVSTQLPVIDVRRQKKSGRDVRVPRLYPNSTIVCLGCGPSLTQSDVDTCQAAGWRAIAIKESYRLAPWAQVLLSSDAYWWRDYQGVPTFEGLKYCLEAVDVPGVDVLRMTGREGIETDPTGIRSGKNTGGAAINLAVHLGAARIVLLGYDMRRAKDGTVHWFRTHDRKRPPRDSPYVAFQQALATMAVPLTELGIEIVNCSRDTALTCFPRRTLAAVMAEAS